MKTWKDYKEYVKAVDPIMGQEIERIEKEVSKWIADQECSDTGMSSSQQNPTDSSVEAVVFAAIPELMTSEGPEPEEKPESEANFVSDPFDRREKAKDTYKTAPDSIEAPQNKAGAVTNSWHKPTGLPVGAGRAGPEVLIDEPADAHREPEPPETAASSES